MNTTLTGKQIRSDSEVEQLVQSNVPLAKYFAQMWKNLYGEHDALSDALLALFNAARLWDGRVPFGSYASLMMKWNMPRRNIEQNRGKRGGGQATLSLHELRLNNGAGAEDTWLDHVMDESTEAPSDRVFEGDADYISSLLSGLKPREREVIERRYGIGREAQSLYAVGDDLSLTAERVRQIQRDTLRKLKQRAAHAELDTL